MFRKTGLINLIKRHGVDCTLDTNEYTYVAGQGATLDPDTPDTNIRVYFSSFSKSESLQLEKDERLAVFLLDTKPEIGQVISGYDDPVTIQEIREIHTSTGPILFICVVK